jgi:hypothetical protein
VLGVVAADARAAVVGRAVVGAVLALGAVAAAVRAAAALRVVRTVFGVVASAVVGALRGAGGSEVLRAFGHR